MADPHLARLKKGVADWNHWRKQNPIMHPNFSYANLTRTDLSEVDLSEADLRRTDLTGADLSKANLSKANLSEANLSKANLSEANLSGAWLIKANLSEANLGYADLSGTDFNCANLGYADLSGADLSGARLNEAYLYEAKLSGANLSGAWLIKANLSEAKLSGVNFYRADLSEADLSGAIVGWAQFDNVDLHTVKGLETIRNRGPSSIGIDTLYRSAGLIPESFLRQTGIPEDFLTYLPSLMKRAIEYYTCFISYSSKDQEFVESLYAHLQAKGVRCWYAPEDLKIGDKIRQRIDETIRLYDKLLLVLSEQSVASPWVEFEVEAALEKERHQNRTVLFPIRLDERVMESHTAWAADIRRSRHIGDFTHWKEHDSYQQGLKRLLRDLQPDRPPQSRTSLH